MNPEELFEQHKQLPEAILRKMFKNPHNVAESKRLQYEDLLQYCYVGLWKACTEFDQDKGVKFTSFAINNIRWNLFSCIRKESVFRRYKASMHNEENNAVEILNLDASPPQDDELSFHDVCPSDRDTLNEVEGILLKEFVYDNITERQKKIMNLRMKDYTLREIGKMLGVSKELVRLDILKVKNLVIEQYGEVVC